MEKELKTGIIENAIETGGNVADKIIAKNDYGSFIILIMVMLGLYAAVSAMRDKKELKIKEKELEARNKQFDNLIEKITNNGIEAELSKLNDSTHMLSSQVLNYALSVKNTADDTKESIEKIREQQAKLFKDMGSLLSKVGGVEHEI